MLNRFTEQSLSLIRHCFTTFRPPSSKPDQPARSAADLLLQEARYVVFDTELTGLSLRKDSVVSLGAVVVERGRIPLGETFYRVVAPHATLTAKSVVIHGITPGEASNFPGIEELLPDFLEFCRDSILVGHFVTIDKGFLNKELRQFNGGKLRFPVLDTYKADSWMRRRNSNPCAFHMDMEHGTTLAALADRYGIMAQQSHNALDDAFVTAQIWQRFLHELPLLGIERIQDILAIAGV